MMLRNYIILFLLVCGVAFGNDLDLRYTGSIDFGFYTPNIDEEPNLTRNVYEDVFDDSGVMFKVGYGVEYLHLVGRLYSDFSIGFFTVDGYGFYPNKYDLETGAPLQSEDETVLYMMPFEWSILGYSFDYLQEQWNIPFVFYIKAGLTATLWWITDGVGDLATLGKNDAIGVKFGLHYALGVRFLLDFVDSDSADNFEQDMGVRDSYIFAEYYDSSVHDFTDEGLHLGGSYWRFGILLGF